MHIRNWYDEKDKEEKVENYESKRSTEIKKKPFLFSNKSNLTINFQLFNFSFNKFLPNDISFTTENISKRKKIIF